MAPDEREEAIAAFEQVATPEERAKAAEVSDALVPVLEGASAIQVRNRGEAVHAAEFLARIAGERRQAEEARTFLVRPLNDHVKAINDRFRGPREALDRATQVVKERLLAYEAEVERRRREEEARLEAERLERERAAEEERRRVEAEARAAREAAAREAARAEAQAKAAEERRQREMREQKDAKRSAFAELSSARLMGIVDRAQEGAPDQQTARLWMEEANLAAEELDARLRARRAQEAAAAAREREEEARAAEQAARDAPPEEVERVELAPREPLKTARGSVGSRKVWKATVVDEACVPRGYMAVDQKAINQAVRDGVRKIPGVRIERVPQVAVRAER